MPRIRPSRCDVPAYLLTSDSPLPKVAEAVKNGQPLDILVVGSRSSTIAASGAQRLSRRGCRPR